MERNPRAAARGHGPRRATRSAPSTASSSCAREYPLLQARARRRDGRAHEQGLLGDDILGSGFSFDVTIVEGAGSYVVGEETALLALPAGAARHRLRAPAVPRPARPARHADGRQQRRDALQHPLRRLARRRRVPRAQPGARRRAPSSSASTSASRDPASYEVPFGMTRARAVRGRRRRPASTAARSRRCRSAARSAGILPGWKLDTRFDFDALAAEGLHGRPRRDRRLRRRAPTCAAVAEHLLHFGAARELRQVLPVPHRAAPAHAMFANGAPVERERARGAARDARGSAASARTAAACPRRSAACSSTSPTSWGSPDAKRHDRRHRGRGRRRHDRPRGRADRGRRRPDALLRRPAGPVRRVPRLPRRRRGRARPDRLRARRRCRDGMAVATQDADARRVATAVVELVLSELPRAPEPHTELAQIAAMLGVTRRPALARRAVHAEAHDDAPSLPRASSHELCISCGRCVRACDEVQGAVRADGHRPRLRRERRRRPRRGFRDSACVSCGACADSCPTDAITEITLLTCSSPNSRGEDDDRTLRPRDHDHLRLLRRRLPSGDPRRATARSCRSRPALDGPANEGHTCLKGRFAHQFSRHRSRLDRRRSSSESGDVPRRHLGGGDPPDRDRARPHPATTHGPRRDRRPRLLARDERGLLRRCSASCARRSAPTTSTTARASATRRRRSRCASRSACRARPATSTDFDHADAAILIGANPTEGHPVVGARIKQATLRGMKLVIDRPAPHRAVPTYGVLHLKPAPRHERRGHARARAHRAPRRPHRPGLPRARAPRASARGRGADRGVHAAGGRADHRHPGRRPRARGAHLRRGRRTPASPGASGSPSTATAPRSCASSATSRS